MEKKVRIVNVVYTFGNQGGMQRVVANLSNHWASSGHEVEIWVWEKHPSAFFEVNEGIVLRSIGHNPDEYFGTNKLFKVVTFLSRLVVGAWKYVGLVRAHRPDMIIIHRAEIDDPFMGFQRLFSKTCEVLHTPFHIVRKRPLSMITSLQRRLFYRLFQPKKNLVVVNPVILKDVIAAGWKNVRCIPNFVSLRSNVKSNGNGKVFLAVGRNAPEKGFSLLLSAFSLVLRKHRDWKLKIVGHGVGIPGNDLHKQVVSLGMQEYVELTEQVAAIEVFFREASVYVLPSYYESTGMVMLEAMEFGLPVICSEIEGLEDIAVPGCTLTFSNGDAHSLADRMISLIGNPDLRVKMSQYALSHVKRYYIEQVAHHWDQLIAEMTSTNRLHK